MLSPREWYPMVLVDVALFSVMDDRLHVLLVRRSEEPHAGQWALPGGILKPDVDQNLRGAAQRVMRGKLSVDVPYLEEVCTASGPQRDERGWSISVLHLALLQMDQVHVAVGKKIDALQWVDACSIGSPLAFDHAELLRKAMARLQTKVERHALPLHMLPHKFTLPQLQRTCEIILGRDLDKSVFRRRLKDLHSQDLVEIAGEMFRGGQRPAQLWRAGDGFQFIG
jgi:8-oxo-dGTP diphosphatase